MFRGIYRLHFQGRKVREARKSMKKAASQWVLATVAKKISTFWDTTP
jgi:hypothetical protein